MDETLTGRALDAAVITMLFEPIPELTPTEYSPWLDYSLKRMWVGAMDSHTPVVSHWVPRPVSSDWAAGILVIDEMRRRGYEFELRILPDGSARSAFGKGDFRTEAKSASQPLEAVCRAAVHAVEVAVYIPIASEPEAALANDVIKTTG